MMNGTTTAVDFFVAQSMKKKATPPKAKINADLCDDAQIKTEKSALLKKLKFLQTEIITETVVHVQRNMYMSMM